MHTTPATTAINTQLLQALVALTPLIDRMCSNDSGTDRWEVTQKITDQARAAIQAAMLQDVLDELIHAHKIIKNALNIVSDTQKDRWAQLNAQFRCDGEGITRANERLAVILRNGGSL